MTPKVLFAIILKILGIWLIKEFLFIIPQLFSFAFANAALGENLSVAIYSIPVVIFYLVSIYLLLFKTTAIINLFQLDKEISNEPLKINADKFDVLEIALIIMGGIVLIDEIPSFISNIINYLNQKQIAGDFQPPSGGLLIINIVKIVIAYLLIAHRKKIISYFDKKAPES